jgi:hypothetical protein
MSVVNWATKVKMVELARCTFIPLLLEGICDWLVVGEDGEVTRFQHVAEVFYGFVDYQKLSVVGAVFLLGSV